MVDILIPVHQNEDLSLKEASKLTLKPILQYFIGLIISHRKSASAAKPYCLFDGVGRAVIKAVHVIKWCIYNWRK